MKYGNPGLLPYRIAYQRMEPQPEQMVLILGIPLRSALKLCLALTYPTVDKRALDKPRGHRTRGDKHLLLAERIRLTPRLQRDLHGRPLEVGRSGQ